MSTQKLMLLTKKETVQHTFHVQCLRPSNLSFTINTYTTRFSLLINGKNSELFLDNDIRHIHNIMSSTKINGTNIDVQRLNQCLAANLEQALHPLTNGQCENVENKNIIDQEVKTAKCLKTRGVECKYGHWVHYSCDKLGESEISTIEYEGNNIVYTCKALNLPTIKTNNCQEQTLAKTLLVEESECNGCVDNTSVVDNRCGNCDLEFHTICLDQSSDQCYSCIGLQKQTDICESSHVQQTTSKQPSGTIPTTQICSLTQPQNVSEQHKIVSNIEIESVINQKEPSAKSQNVADINMSKITNKYCNETSDTNAIKMKELRQLEQQLKKKEEQLKIKEIMINDEMKDKLRIMERLHNAEIKNLEQENTIKTLTTRVENDNPKHHVNDNTTKQSNNDNDDIVVGI